MPHGLFDVRHFFANFALSNLLHNQLLSQSMSGNKADSTPKPNTGKRTETNTCARMSYILFPAIFALSSIVLLMTGAGAPYLRKLEDLSFFMGGQWFFNHCMSVPAGFIDWIASFLTQFFYYPWLGATIFTAALIGLWALTSATFRLPRNLSVRSRRREKIGKVGQRRCGQWKITKKSF